MAHVLQIHSCHCNKIAGLQNDVFMFYTFILSVKLCFKSIVSKENIPVPLEIEPATSLKNATEDHKINN